MKNSKYIAALITFPLLVIVWAAHIYISESLIDSIDNKGLEDYLLSKKRIAQKFNFPAMGNTTPNKELYRPFPQYYAFKQLPLELIKAAYLYEKTCHEADYLKADAIAQKHTLSPSKLLQWHKAVCQKDSTLFSLWHKRKPFLHPNGHSYSFLFKQHFPHLAKTTPLFLHISERAPQSDFDKFYKNLSLDDQKKYLLNTDKSIINNSLVFIPKWNGRQQNVYVYPLAKLNKELAFTHSFHLTLIESATNCSLLLGSLCFEPLKKAGAHWESRWNYLTTLYVLIYLTFFSFYFTYLKKKQVNSENEDQALLFQLISHEVRTPLTSLGLNLDSLRHQFENLNSEGQKSLMHSLDNFHKLEKIIQKSLQEIRNNHQDKEFDIYSLTDEIIYQHYNEAVLFEPQDKKCIVRMSPFWYEICLSNLIKNAIHHGVAPIKVSLSEDKHQISLSVQDQGNTDLKILKKMLNPNDKNPKSKGLGIGLSMINRKINEVGGELVINANPTTYTIKFKAVTKVTL